MTYVIYILMTYGSLNYELLKQQFSRHKKKDENIC